MLEPMTNSWALLALLMALGFRHGLDPDHIAAVDGMTRARHRQPAYWSARYTGLQFAFGHSLMILLAALVFHWQAVKLPQWLDDVGSWVSASFLLLLASLNLYHCLSRTGHPHPARLSQRLIARLMGRFAHPIGVGFVFAISLDSLAQAALMATQGDALGGLGMIMAMTMLFGLGMMLADTTNGAVMHWLVTQCESLAQYAGRIMSGLIAGLSLLVIAASLGRKHVVGLERLWGDWAPWIGVSVTAAVILAYLLIRRIASRSTVAMEVAPEAIQRVTRRWAGGPELRDD